MYVTGALVQIKSIVEYDFIAVISNARAVTSLTLPTFVCRTCKPLLRRSYGTFSPGKEPGGSRS